MAPWKRLCCPVDFSRESRAAMQEAAELARCSGAALELVHVDDRPAPSGGAPSLVPAETLRGATLELERQLGEWAESARHVLHGPVRFALLAGAPADEIVRFARQGGFDAVVMGTHGRTGRERLVFGSVAQAVVRDAPCTVVVVRARAAT
jgi:nucleotide-binding universal stress UspA family protein